MNWEEKYNAVSELVDGYRRERDEAREQLDLTKRELGRWVDRETRAVHERDEARAEVAELLHRMLYVHPSSLTDACTDSFRRGAEAMREACASMVDGFSSGATEKDVLDLPIPEEP